MTAVAPSHRPIAWAVPLIALLAALAVLPSASRTALAGNGSPGAISWPAPAGQASPALTALAARAPERRVEVIVQLRPAATLPDVERAVGAAGGEVIRSLPLINGLAARMPARAAVALAQQPGVRAVSPNARVEGRALIDPTKLKTAYNQSIRADRVWARGVTGKGATVAVIDTGVAGGLPDFRTSQSDTRSRVSVVATANPRAANADDSYGHGTHVAGLIAGNGANRDANDPNLGSYVGVAPDASLVAVKVDDGKGYTTALDIIDGLQFVVTHRDQYDIRVVNLSVTSTVAESYLTDPLDAAVEAVWNRGIVVVVAAGNRGTAADAVSYAPANDPYVITVGGVDDQGTKDVEDDVIASWSSRGRTQDGFAKPDVLAPGAHMVAPLSPGSHYASACPSCVVDGGYLRIGGTSMAAAVASGAVADVVSAHPDWTPDQIKATLVARTRALPGPDGASDTELEQATDGEIALDKALFTADGRPEAPANQGLTPSSWIDPKTGDIELAAGSWSAGSWSAGSWSAGSWSAGSWSAATGDYAPAWASASFTGAPLSPDGFEPTPASCSQLARTGWSAGSWSAGSWSATQLDSAKSSCETAAATQAGSWSAGSWSAGSWSAGSWSAGSWSAGSWSAGSWSTAFDK